MTVYNFSKSYSKKMWMPQEDEVLKQIIGTRVTVTDWTSIAHTFNQRVMILNSTSSSQFSTRNSKQCRQRWQNHLSPCVKNASVWSQEELQTLLNLYKQNNNQWCVITNLLVKAGFDRRGDNHVKNYFHCILKKTIKVINDFIAEENKRTKKLRFSDSKYKQKYQYKNRFSVEREIKSRINTYRQKEQIRPVRDTEGIKEENISSEQRNIQLNKQTEPIQIQNCTQQNQNLPPQHHQFKLIKLLDQVILSKIFLISSGKAVNKLNINEVDYIDESVSLRDHLLEIMKNVGEAQFEQCLDLAHRILNLSKNCKRIKGTANKELVKKKKEEEKRITSKMLAMKAKAKLRKINFSHQESSVSEIKPNLLESNSSKIHQNFMDKGEKPLFSQQKSSGSFGISYLQKSQKYNEKIITIKPIPKAQLQKMNERQILQRVMMDESDENEQNPFLNDNDKAETNPSGHQSSLPHQKPQLDRNECPFKNDEMYNNPFMRLDGSRQSPFQNSFQYNQLPKYANRQQGLFENQYNRNQISQNQLKFSQNVMPKKQQAQISQGPFDFIDSKDYKSSYSPFFQESSVLFRSQQFGNNFNMAKKQEEHFVEKNPSIHMNLGQSGFLSTIRQVQATNKHPVLNNSQLIDFEIPFPSFNPFYQPNMPILDYSLNFMSCDQYYPYDNAGVPLTQPVFGDPNPSQNIFSRSNYVSNHPSNHHSNHSHSRHTKRSREKDSNEMMQINYQMMMQSQRIMNRSWAYPEPNLELKRTLSTSNHYDSPLKLSAELNKGQFHSNFPLLQKNEDNCK